MELKNYEILNANAVLGELLDEKLKGKLKFKLFKNKVALEEKLEAVSKSLEGVVDEKEREEILNETQEVDFAPFTESELEPLPLSVRQLILLKKLMEKEGEDK